MKKNMIIGSLILTFGLIYWGQRTPGNAIRSYTIYSGHPFKAIQTTIYKGTIDENYGQLYVENLCTIATQQ